MDYDSASALACDDFLVYQYETLGILDCLRSPDITEICINQPGELYVERRG